MAAVSSKSPSRTTAPTPEESAAWVRRVHDVQSQRLTPEQRQEILQRVERSRVTETRSKKCKAMKSHVFRSNALAYEGLQQMASAAGGDRADFSEVATRWQAAQRASEQRQTRAMERLSRDAPAAASVVRASADESDEDEEEAMAEAAAIVGSSAARLTAVQAQIAGAPEELQRPRAGRAAQTANPVEALLQQLRVEPAEGDECAAKFQLYEGYSQQVEKTRQLLFDFYDDCKSTVPQAVASDMNRKLRGVDTREAMGVHDDDRRTWIVYSMMKVAEKNNRSMGSVLEGFETTLDLLAKNDQTECPVCMEAFAEDGPKSVETLSCCHKLCQECWEHWKHVTRGHPFCPLCRNEEFLGFVAGAAAEAL